MTIKIVSYNSINTGPTLLVIGAIHGDERCGPEAIKRVIEDFDQKNISLSKGKVIFIPVANPRAYQENVRFIERNLNRYLYPKEKFTCYEDHLDPIICKELKEADIVLDLHSYSSTGGPFIFLGKGNVKEQSYARDLGVNHFVYGWEDAYGNKGDNDKKSIGTTEYARQEGAIAITLECGQHDNENNADIGYSAICRALNHFDMIDNVNITYDSQYDLENQFCIKMKDVFYKTENGKWTQEWKNFDFVKKGQNLAKNSNGASIVAKEDGYIILPKDTEKIGAEWFYFGVKVDFPA